MSCYNIITVQLYKHGRCLNEYIYVFWYMCGNGLWHYLNKNILSNGHLMYQEARLGLDLQPDEDKLREGQVGGFHL
jgi:hypothetical protein